MEIALELANIERFFSSVVLTLPLTREVLVIELVALPARRGPASEARACYRLLDAGAAKRIAGDEHPRAKAQPEAEEGEAQQ